MTMMGFCSVKPARSPCRVPRILSRSALIASVDLAIGSGAPCALPGPVRLFYTPCARCLQTELVARALRSRFCRAGLPPAGCWPAGVGFAGAKRLDRGGERGREAAAQRLGGACAA